MPSGVPRILNERALNRALLARQLLLSRSRASLPRVLEQMGCLQAQYAPSMYIGLWTRLERFERRQLDRALERRSVVLGTMMRVTIHLASARDYWPLTEAIRGRRCEGWLRARRDQVSQADLTRAAKRLRPRFDGGALSRAEIQEVVGKDPVLFNGLGMVLDLVRVPPSGTWERRRADIYALAEDWLGSSPAASRKATEHLVRRYLKGFGPASGKNIADWAGLPVKDVSDVLEGLRLRRFLSEGGEELVDLPRAPLPDPETRAPARFLPAWDATLLAHTRRTGILPERYRSRVFSTKAPQSVNTFLVDGVVAGIWRYEKGNVKLEPFGKLGKNARRELLEEAKGLAKLHA